MKYFLNIIAFTGFLLYMTPVHANEKIEGGWSMKHGSTNETLVFVDGYISHAVFDIENKQFLFTRGGKYEIEGNNLIIEWQYDTEKTEQEIPNDSWLGQKSEFTLDVNGQKMKTNISEAQYEWSKLGSSSGTLNGVWRMSGRKQGEEMSITPLRERRTLKILTGTRFQWIAINIATGEFLGTGGGKYTFENGQYTEHI